MSFRTLSPRFLLLILSIASAASLDAGGRLAMRVSPAQSFAPATLWIQVRVEPNADNRAIEVVADSSDFYRSSLMPLDGDRAPRVITFEFRGVPGGDYDVAGVLTDSAGHQCASVRQQVTVIPSASER